MNSIVSGFMNVARAQFDPAVVGSFCTLLAEPKPPVMVLGEMHLDPHDAGSALNNLC